MADNRRHRALFDLDGRVALVTGSSRGIGRGLAAALGRAGAVVVINGRDPAAVDEATAALRSDGLAVHARAGDVTDESAVAELVEWIERDVGPLDILVNSAGVQQRAPFLEFPVGDFRRLLEINLVAPFAVAQAAARPMAARGRGKIINVGSVQSQLGRPTIVPYTASKGGLKLLTRGLCADLGPLGIQVNTLAPGYFATDLTAALVEDESFSAWVADRTPAGRWGDVAELGGPVVFLASDAGSFVNGQTLFVDGGMTAVV
ncbi:MAG: SDR family oxidoreductase [Actinomycetota bacterium]